MSTVQKLEELFRITQKLQHHVSVRAWSEAAPLLWEIERLIDGHPKADYRKMTAEVAAGHQNA